MVEKKLVSVVDKESRTLPDRLSPSRLSDFKQCPAKFFYASILKLPRPATVATTVGTLAHEAFERVFDHPAHQRTPEVAISYILPCWEKLSTRDEYLGLLEFKDEILNKAQDSVRSWFLVERPHNFEPHKRETRLTATINGTEILGIIDRVDNIETESGTKVYISDYKTGKPVSPDDRFLDDKFFAMRVYALLWSKLNKEIPHELRLIYVNGASRDSVRKLRVDERVLKRAEAEVKAITKEMKKCEKESSWPCKKQVLCQWCEFQSMCPVWNHELSGMQPGTMKRLPDGSLSD
jgi:putative RecB family exonuclease